MSGGRFIGPLFAAVHLPGFGLQAIACWEKELAGRAMVLMEETGRKGMVVALNQGARQAGVAVGMTAPQALARCPGAVVRGRSPEKEKLVRDWLLAAAFTLSPRVEETAEGLCTVDLRGTAGGHSFSSQVEQARRLVEELGKLGLVARVGLASKPRVAFWAARSADPVLEVRDEGSFLADLPLAVADPTPAMADVLHQWGVKTLGAFVALPRQEIAKRLGKEGIALWDRAAGREERVLKLAELPEEFEQGMELDHEMETLEPLLFIIRRFIGQLGLRLGVVYQVAEEVGLDLRLSDHSRYERVFRLPEPTREPDLLFRMLHTHLEGVRTEFPIVAIRLWMKPCAPVSKQQDLFEAAVKDTYGFSDTLARLVAVVGSGNVGSPRLEPTHRPDVFRLVPLADIGPSWVGREDRNWGGDDCRRSASMRRYRPVLAAQVRVEGGQPASVETDGLRVRICRARGPWRLSGNWWDPQRWGRDEWDIECSDGGLYRLVREGGKWFLEGEYG